MHIGFLTSEYPGISKKVGGIGTSIKFLSQALAERDQKVTIFLYGQDKDVSIDEEHIRIIKIKHDPIKGFSWWFLRKKIERIINDEVRNNGLQILEAPDWTGITAFMKIDCPVVVKLHGSDTYFCHIENRKRKYKNYLLEKTALKNADGVVSVSKYTAELTSELFCLKKKIEVIYNGIDIDSFSSQPSGTKNNDRTLLYFGTLIRKKGMLELPYIFNRVIEKVPNAKLYLVGGDSADITTGSDSTWILMKRLFSDTAIKSVYYLGKVPHEEIKKHIEASTVCVFPSFAEAFPISWLEAMASGKAIVGSDRPWAKEMIDEGITGLLEDPKNHDQYASKIVYLLKNNQLADTMGKNAYKVLQERFGIDSIAKQMIGYYQEIVRKVK